MFLSMPAFGDDSVPTEIATSKASSAPGFTMSFQNASPATADPTFTRVTRTFVVDAVHSWMFDDPAIVTRAVSIARGSRGCATGPAVHAVAARTTAIGAVRNSGVSDMEHLVGFCERP